jgi:hypothetical protein
VTTPEPVKYECPNCGERLELALPPTSFPTHPCPQASGLSTPMARVTSWDTAGRSARVRLLEREDYVGQAKGLLFDAAGRPIMSADLERRDGSNDRLVFVPPATARDTEE